jgi:cytoskeleton protein RodZ
VTETQANATAQGGGMPPATTAGALLGAARAASGLSIDAVAQQLKLAPRQVRALEEGDYTHLPGRTFVRGFVRNYARLVHLDPDAVVGALPAGAAAPALEAPTLQQTAPTMGELPTTDHSRPAWTRWAMPLTWPWRGAAVGMVAPQATRHLAARTAAAWYPLRGPAGPRTPLPNPMIAGRPDGSVRRVRAGRRHGAAGNASRGPAAEQGSPCVPTS